MKRGMEGGNRMRKMRLLLRNVSRSLRERKSPFDLRLRRVEDMGMNKRRVESSLGESGGVEHDRDETRESIRKGVRADARIELRRLREKGGPGAEALGSPFRG
jgi:hypothetical protein